MIQNVDVAVPFLLHSMAPSREGKDKIRRRDSRRAVQCHGWALAEWLNIILPGNKLTVGYPHVSERAAEEWGVPWGAALGRTATSELMQSCWLLPSWVGQAHMLTLPRASVELRFFSRESFYCDYPHDHIHQRDSVSTTSLLVFLSCRFFSLFKWLVSIMS